MSAPSDMTEAQARHARIAAAQDRLRWIVELKKCAAWEAYYLPRLRAKVSQLGEDILDTESMSPADRELKLAIRQYLKKEILTILDDDIRTAQADASDRQFERT